MEYFNIDPPDDPYEYMDDEEYEAALEGYDEYDAADQQIKAMKEEPWTYQRHLILCSDSQQRGHTCC